MESIPTPTMPRTRGYQQEMLEESLRRNLIIALDTGSGKTHIAILRIKIEAERTADRVSWFIAPTVALCEQQRDVISTALPVSVGLISGALEPDQWKDRALWRRVLNDHRVIVSTPQVLLDAMRHGYINLGRDIGLLVFDEAHHAIRDHPYNLIMKEFYFALPVRANNATIAAAAQQGERLSMRPMILGLTASPLYRDGSVEMQFRAFEASLDSTIRSPRRNREELANHVHKPVFKHALYTAPDYEPLTSGSHNLDALRAVKASLKIEDDPYVHSLRHQLSRLPPNSSDYRRVDQKLSKTIKNASSYTHKGFKEFTSSAEAICIEMGPWAADWYVEKVLDYAMTSTSPFDTVMNTNEKNYLLDNLARVTTISVSRAPEDIKAGISNKVEVLIQCLQAEISATEEEGYRGLIFVTRRDSVLALAEILSSHPDTSVLFDIGGLLGSSESSKRHSFLDITRHLLQQTANETLADFRAGEINLLVATSVAEEGLDIQACGSVIRFDPPANMVSWAQSRGRARRQRSTFTLLFEDSGVDRELVAKWQRLEAEMANLHNDPSRDNRLPDNPSVDIPDGEDEDLHFRVDSTGALLTLHSAISHLDHFCAVLPSASYGNHTPLYEIDPPDLPEGWHSYPNRPAPAPYTGPYGSRVTLPRMLPSELREYSVDRIYKTKISAHRHVAYKAYVALYRKELLNDHLLPLTSVLEPDLEEEVQALLKEVAKRSGTAGVSRQLNPWIPETIPDGWWCTEMTIGSLLPLRMYTRSELPTIKVDERPVLYRPNRAPVTVQLQSLGLHNLSLEQVSQAQEYTRSLFWHNHGARMEYTNLNFAYLFLRNDDENDSLWTSRRLSPDNADGTEFFANARLFGEQHSYPEDITFVRHGDKNGTLFEFVRWQFTQPTAEEVEKLEGLYAKFSDVEIAPPFLVVRPFPPRMNFLLPTSSKTTNRPQGEPILLLAKFSTILLYSSTDSEFATLLPSILRHMAMATTACCLRDTVLASTPLSSLSLGLLMNAITAPVSQERTNYERLETLGDTVLKFITGIQLLARYPLWHEGYLSKKKDHAVSNARLSKEALGKGLYRFIIRNKFRARKWTPEYLHNIDNNDAATDPNVKPGNEQELSTKVMADVVESLLGISYVQGGFDLAVECARFFGLGLEWERLPLRIDTMLSRVEHADDIPTQITDVETMLGYTFNRKLLLVEALTHASHQQDMRTISYERLEFLGDSVLDMVVTDYLYHAPGKNYSPGHLHLRKSAVVNTHFLAYICLRCSLITCASMPRPRGSRHNISVSLVAEQRQVYLWQFLLHSSPRVLDDQHQTFTRFTRGKADLEKALSTSKIFPWASLTRLQAPKFFSDMIESLIGAIFLDSGGDLDAVRRVLDTLGILPILERIVRDDVDILHPVSRMSNWAQQHEKEIEYEFEKVDRNIICVLTLDGIEEVRVVARWRGRASQNEVKFQAAELAIQKFHLRDTVHHTDSADEEGDVSVEL